MIVLFNGGRRMSDCENLKRKNGQELHCNYVIFDDMRNEFYRTTLKDLYGYSNVIVKNPPLGDEPAIIRALYRVHVSDHFDKFINLPFKSLWNKKLAENSFDDSKPICFFFSSGMYYARRLGFFEYLKKEYPGCKLVFCCRDLFSLFKERYRNFDEQYVKDTFDLILNYDIREVKKHGLVFYPDFESTVNIGDGGGEGTDVVFVGAAKNRLNLILQTYEVLDKAGLACDFNITEVEDEQIKAKYPRINFMDKWMPYHEVLDRIARSRCILEIIQDNSVGWSARAMKAFMYNKKLITNAKAVRYTRFFDGKDVQYFESPDTIDTDAIKDPAMPDFRYNGEYSPRSVLQYVDEMLCNDTTQTQFFSDWLNLESYCNQLADSNG